jgi:hypothetical protein
MIGYLLMSFHYRNLNWIYESNIRHHAIFVVMGVSYTLFREYINVYLRNSWSYSDYMPLLPYANIGVVPLIQWIILPPVIIFITKRQIRG